MASSSRRAPPADTAENGDDDDLPPPYTPSPNVRLGEETIGLGPQRPFQQPHPHPHPHHHQSHSYSHPPPPPAQPFQPVPTGLAPWQTQQQYYQRPSGGGGLIGSLIDTFRDIADVVTGAHDDERWVVLHGANTGAYAAPGPHPGAGPVYAPPPGPPGQAHRPPLPPRRPASTPPRAPPTVPDDGTPTRTPVPGHPLLRDGHLLVYPRNYVCDKCYNTGYKNYDPSHPCRKCWEKYSKSYTGAITYTNWTSSGNDSRMQRPLPKFVPPHLSGQGPGLTSGSVHAPPSQHLHHTRSVSQPHTQGSGPAYYVVSPLNPYDTTPPVPHAIAVSPGDPRLGGRLCHRCGGAGVQTVFLFDERTCDYCGGAGRVWT